jgi:hypothetical protein
MEMIFEIFQKIYDSVSAFSTFSLLLCKYGKCSVNAKTKIIFLTLTPGDLQLLWTEDGRRIEWNHVCELEKQSVEKLQLANKITKDHIQFSKKKRCEFT